MVKVLFLLEIAVLLTFFYVGVTQLVMPIWNGTPVFPFFRKTRQVEHALKEAKDEVELALTEKEIEHQQFRAEKLRKSNSTTTSSKKEDAQ